MKIIDLNPDQFQTIRDANSYFNTMLSNTDDLELCLKHFILLVKSLVDNYFIFYPSDTIELGDYIIGACHITNWGVSKNRKLHSAVANTSVSAFTPMYGQKDLRELEKELPSEVEKLKKIAWPLDFPHETLEEKSRMDMIQSLKNNL